MALKYSKAPVSEIIFGVFFKTNALMRNAMLFEILLKLKDNYPLFVNAPSAPIEEIQNDNLTFTQEVSFSSYRVSSRDLIYSIELSQNSFQVIWQRRDDMPSVSEYPGYEKLYGIFNEIYSQINSIAISHGISLGKEVKLYNLKYGDRVNLKPYKETGLHLKDIIKLNYPPIYIDGIEFYSDNYLGKYTVNLSTFNSYAIVNINTPTHGNIGQILLVDNSIKGYSDNVANWFDRAHQSQLSFFENIFTETILNDWK